MVSLPASPALQSISQVYEQGRGKGTMTAEEKRSVKQEMAEEMEQLDRFPHGILGPWKPGWLEYETFGSFWGRGLLAGANCYVSFGEGNKKHRAIVVLGPVWRP